MAYAPGAPAPLTRIPDPLHPLPDLSGRLAVVTGGAGGIGLATTRVLARGGADVLVGARDVARAERAVRAMRAEETASGGRIDVAPLDLLDLDAVARFADRVHRRVDLLLLNAGSSSGPLRLSREGVESQLAVNHLGHFALTGRLLARLAADARVVTVSSSLYAAGELDLEDLASAGSYSPGRAYIRSKLANVLFARELGRRLAVSGSGVRSYAAHPGMARTPLHATYPSRLTRVVTRVLAGVVGREPEPAAVGIVAAAVHAEAAPDLFWGPAGSRTRPDAVGRAFSRVATDEELAARLWEVSERITGVAPGV